MTETGIKHRAILASENLTEILLSLKLNAMHDRLETMLDMCGTMLAPVCVTGFVRK